MRFSPGQGPAPFVALTLVILGACSSRSSGVPPPAGLTYADSAPVYDTCTSIIANVPTIGSGLATSYSVTPALPAGLSLDTTSGYLSGTPIEPIAATSFTITAANAGGETTFDLSIAVDSTLTTGISYDAPSTTQLVAFAASWMPTIGTGTVDTWSVSSGTLPTGLTLDPSTGEISGTPTQPCSRSVTIAASNCESAPATTVIDFHIEPWYPSSMYVTNNIFGSSTISSALWDDTLGALRPTGWSVPISDRLAAPTLHPDGKALYLTENALGGIQQFELDAVNGRLAETGTAFGFSQVPTDLAITPDGAFLYALCPDGDVYMFAIDPDDHSLSPLTPTFVYVGGSPQRMAMHPTGAYLLLVDDVLSSLQSFAIDSETGRLTFAASISSEGNPTNVSISPLGNHVYVSTNTPEIRGYSFDTRSGALEHLPNTPYSTASTLNCFDLVFDPTGEHAYAPSSSAAHVLQYDVDTVSGDLTLMRPSTFPIEAPARGIAVDPRGERLYTTMTSDRIQVLAISGFGSLSFAAEPLIAMRAGATDIVFSTTSTPHELVSEALYAASYPDDFVYNFDLDDGVLDEMPLLGGSGGADNIESLTMLWMTGRLYANEPAFNYHQPPPGALPLTTKFVMTGTHQLLYDGWFAHTSPTHALVPNTNERFAHALTDAGIIATSIDGSGNWSSGQTIPLTGTPDDAAMHPGGSLLLVTNPGDNRMSAYAIDPSTGDLLVVGEIETQSEPVEALVTPSGRFAYAVSRSGAAIDMAAIDMTTGQLNPLAAAWIPSQADEVDAALSPTGRFLAVASSSTGIEMFSINTDPADLTEDGSLTSLGVPTATAQAAASIEFDSSGSFLYVGLTSSGIETFRVEANGSLVSLGLTSSGGGLLDLALRLAVH